MDQELALFIGKFGKAALKGFLFLASEIELLRTLSSHELENLLTEHESIAGDFSTVGECFETSHDTGPLHKRRFRIVLIKLPPNDERRLLQDVGGVGCGRDQGADKAPEVRFMTRVEGYEFLVAGVVLIL